MMKYSSPPSMLSRIVVLVGAEGGPGVSEHLNLYPYVHYEYRDYYSPIASPDKIDN